MPLKKLIQIYNLVWVQGTKSNHTVLVGTGIAGLNLIDEFLEKKKIIHVISPDTNSVILKDIKII